VHAVVRDKNKITAEAAGLKVFEGDTTDEAMLFNAAKAYWAWWQQYYVQLLFGQAVKNAEQRYNFVKTAFRIGERPAIDTVEALAQLQSIQMKAREFQLERANAQLEVSMFLWQNNGQVYQLPEGIVPQQLMPEMFEILELQRLLQEMQLHPELTGYRFKLDALQVEKQLKFQSLLPAVDLKYNQLNKSHDLRKSFSTPWLQNNFRYGMSVSLPLRFSEGRGEYRKVKLKLEQTELERVNKQVVLGTKLQQSYNEWKALGSQMVLQEQALQSYIILQKGEEMKFANGESSLFLVNARELKTLEAQQKILELQSKEQKAIAGSLWTAGTLADF
jgi:outer membrane protein TolC